MKKGDILKIAAIIIIPGGIPAWLGYTIYSKLKKGSKDDKTGVSTNSQSTD